MWWPADCFEFERGGAIVTTPTAFEAHGVWIAECDLHVVCAGGDLRVHQGRHDVFGAGDTRRPGRARRPRRLGSAGALDQAGAHSVGARRFGDRMRFLRRSVSVRPPVLT